MWSGSGDKTIAAHDARPGSAPSTLFSLGEQGGYVKALLVSGWTVWALTSAACKVGRGGDGGGGGFARSLQASSCSTRSCVIGG